MLRTKQFRWGCVRYGVASVSSGWWRLRRCTFWLAPWLVYLLRDTIISREIQWRNNILLSRLIISLPHQIGVLLFNGFRLSDGEAGKGGAASVHPEEVCSSLWYSESLKKEKATGICPDGELGWFNVGRSWFVCPSIQRQNNNQSITCLESREEVSSRLVTSLLICLYGTSQSVAALANMSDSPLPAT